MNSQESTDITIEGHSVPVDAAFMAGFGAWLRWPYVPEADRSGRDPQQRPDAVGVLQVGVNDQGWVVLDWMPGP